MTKTTAETKTPTTSKKKKKRTIKVQFGAATGKIKVRKKSILGRLAKATGLL